MNLQISEKAVEWYKNELNIQSHTNLRFFIRYGFGGIQPGFSLGVAINTPVEPLTKFESEDILFFIEQEDSWYFDDHDLNIEYDERLSEPKFNYI